MKPTCPLYAALLSFSLLISAARSSFAAAPGIHIRIVASQSRAPVGGSVVLRAAVTENHRPASGLLLWPYLNGRRWGAQERTGADGRARFLIPLPDVGTERLSVIVAPQKPKPDAFWIWGGATRDQQTLYFRKNIMVTGGARDAKLWITCDDSFHAYLNGHEVASGTNFQQVQTARGLALRPGTNTLAVEGTNGVGPAGLLARLTFSDARGAHAIATGSGWEVFQVKPANWPMPVAPLAPITGKNRAPSPPITGKNAAPSPPITGKNAAPLPPITGEHAAPSKRLRAIAGSPATIEAPVGGGPWAGSLKGWPGRPTHTNFPVGLPAPSRVIHSNTVTIRVARRTFHVIRDPNHLVGMEWEPWFTPLNDGWQTAEAVPLVGDYDSMNTDVIRQHAYWMIDAGINFLLVDWSNNLWDKKHWSERAPGVAQLIAATTRTLDTYARMRDEGIPVPQITLLLGLDNGPSTTTTALNEEMQWVYNHYVHDPRYHGLWLYYEGKPLIVPFNGGGPGILAHQPPIDDSEFTVRWMSSQLQFSHLEREGYWSWMDGVVHPIATPYHGHAEALTVTPAFFGDGGWTYPQALGRRGGATYLEEFTTALQDRPRFLLINQWNEFAGQPNGSGYGPKHDQYVDTYDVPLSDDIEPTSLTACAYRGCGGWGFYYLNLTRALVALYHEATPEDTILAIARPQEGQKVSGGSLPLEWTSIGRPVSHYTVLLDGRVVAHVGAVTSYRLDLRGIARGPHQLIVRADGATTHFSLSREAEDPVGLGPAPCQVAVRFFVD